MGPPLLIGLTLDLFAGKSLRISVYCHLVLLSELHVALHSVGELLMHLIKLLLTFLGDLSIPGQNTKLLVGDVEVGNDPAHALFVNISSKSLLTSFLGCEVSARGTHFLLSSHVLFDLARGRDFDALTLTLSLLLRGVGLYILDRLSDKLWLLVFGDFFIDVALALAWRHVTRRILVHDLADLGHTILHRNLTVQILANTCLVRRLFHFFRGTHND